MEWLNEITTHSYETNSEREDQSASENYRSDIIVPGYNLPDLKWIHNKRNCEGMQEIPLDEAQISHEQRELLRSNSLPSYELYVKSNSHSNTESNEHTHEIFLANRFLSPDELDAEGCIIKRATNGTIYSRYTIINDDLEYLRADHLTEYHQSGSIQRRRKMESAFIKFDSLDKQTQQQIRMRLSETPRTLSEDGLNFISSQSGKFRAMPYERIDEHDATETCIGYGHILSDEEIEILDWTNGISEEQAKAWLKEDLKTISENLNGCLNVFVTQYEFDALVSLASIHGTYSKVFTTLLNLIHTFQLKKACAFIEQSGFPKYRGKSEAIIFSVGKYSR